jgi:hypothetical protein
MKVRTIASSLSFPKLARGTAHRGIAGLTLACLMSIATVKGQTSPTQALRAAMDAQEDPVRAAELLWAGVFTRCDDFLFFLRKRTGDPILIE